VGFKEDMESIKSDIVGEGRFLEQYVKIENFIKRHKMKLYGLFAVVVIVIGANIVSDYNQEQKRMAANEAYNTLLKDPTNESAKKSLQANAPLFYDLLALKEAVKAKDIQTLSTLSASANPLIAQFATYQLAVVKGDNASLAAIKQEGGLGDFARFMQAFNALEKGEMELGHRMLAGIGFSSPLKNGASALEHYGITAKAQ